MSKQSLIKAFEKHFGLTLSVKRTDGVNHFVDNGTTDSRTTLSVRTNWLERKARSEGVEIAPFTLRSEHGAPLKKEEEEAPAQSDPTEGEPAENENAEGGPVENEASNDQN